VAGFDCQVEVVESKLLQERALISPKQNQLEEAQSENARLMSQLGGASAVSSREMKSRQENLHVC
jgi:hypothetical protein